MAVGTVRQQAYWENTVALFHALALKTDPDNWMAYTMVGGEMMVNAERQYLAGEEQAAKPLFQSAADLTDRSLKLNPTYYQSMYVHAWSLYRLGRTDESIRLFHEAIEANPDFGPSYMNLGLILAQQGKVDEAIPLFEEAVRPAAGGVGGPSPPGRGPAAEGAEGRGDRAVEGGVRWDPRNEDARVLAGAGDEPRDGTGDGPGYAAGEMIAAIRPVTPLSRRCEKNSSASRWVQRSDVSIVFRGEAGPE